MTRAERIAAFAMRLDGKSWVEIGETLGYSPGAALKDLRSCLEGTQKAAYCVYPAIARAIQEEFGGSIRSLADAAGISYNTAYNILTGRADPGRHAAILSEAAGLPAEVAFMRGDV